MLANATQEHIKNIMHHDQIGSFWRCGDGSTYALRGVRPHVTHENMLYPTGPQTIQIHRLQEGALQVPS